MKREKLKNENGFSLVEVMVAMVVLLIFVVAFSALFTDSFSIIFSSGRKSEAQYQAQEASEWVLSGVDPATVSGITITPVPEFTIEIENNAIDDLVIGGDQLTYSDSYISTRGNTGTVDITIFIPSGEVD